MPGQARLLPRLRGSFLHALPNRWQFFLWGIVGQRTKAGLPFSWRHHPVQASKPPWQQVRAALGRRLFKEEVLILYASPFRDSTNIQKFCCQNGIRVWEGKGSRPNADRQCIVLREKHCPSDLLPTKRYLPNLLPTIHAGAQRRGRAKREVHLGHDSRALAARRGPCQVLPVSHGAMCQNTQCYILQEAQ